MNDKTEHFDENYDSQALGNLAGDLKGLFESSSLVPGEVDRAVLDRARQKLTRRPRRLSWPRWAAAGAAAAVIFLAVLLQTDFSPMPERTSKSVAPLLEAAAASLPRDIDLNGRVDILDAFKLARHVESAKAVETKWDFNGDGLVNRKDVENIAFAAVRLDKGV